VKELRTALVFGGSGFIGRWLVAELLTQQLDVVAAVRSAGSGTRLVDWLLDHHLATDRLRVVTIHESEPFLGLSSATRAVTEVYNVAGAYAFGMTMEDARAANVVFAENVVTIAAGLPGLIRLVHVSGYRVGGQDPELIPWADQRRKALYKKLGAYEASKVEGDAVVRARAHELSVPLTILNPSSVIGHSQTGESDPQLGLAEMLRDLWFGKLAALPGGSDIWVPVVAVDYLARMLALMPTLPETAGRDYWLLHDDTPLLHDLIRLVARHWDVRVPRIRLPVSVIRRLPAALTRANSETLGFLTADRYPTLGAVELAMKSNVQSPRAEETILRWADALAATRFGIEERDQVAR
jgi:dihydroflavonol-4-reductase